MVRWLEITTHRHCTTQRSRSTRKIPAPGCFKRLEWHGWLEIDGHDRLLWLHGIPGAGKTVLASFAIEQLKEICSHEVGLGCAYYYCHYSHKQDEAAPLLRWAVSQLCRQAKMGAS